MKISFSTVSACSELRKGKRMLTDFPSKLADRQHFIRKLQWEAPFATLATKHDQSHFIRWSNLSQSFRLIKRLVTWRNHVRRSKLANVCWTVKKKRWHKNQFFFRIGNHKISNNKFSTISEVNRRARDYKKDRIKREDTKDKAKKNIFKIHS